MRWVIAYDVRGDRGRRRIARRLEQVGFRRQKSVFEGVASPAEVEELLDELATVLEDADDSLMAWPTAENGPAATQHRGRVREPTERDWLVL